jgi:hypothetical protein
VPSVARLTTYYLLLTTYYLLLTTYYFLALLTSARRTACDECPIWPCAQ